MKYLLKGKEIYTAHGILRNTGIMVDGSRISSLGANSQDGYTEIDLGKFRVLPGLIDLHIHGVNGFDTMDGTYTSINEMSKYLARIGVTSFLATTVTSGMERIEKAVANVADCITRGTEGAKLLGSYIEGPYITKEHKGAHPEQLIRDICMDEIDNLIKISKNTVRVYAIAPEKPNSSNAIKHLAARGIKVAMGHSNATFDEAEKAVESGASIAIHVYNGMRGLHHREAGLLGAALCDDRVNVEMICDCVHVGIPAMQIVVRCKKEENIVLITDCMMAGGLSDGEYMLGEFKVKVKGNEARTESGSLSGSTLRLKDAVANMEKHVGVPFEKALRMATLNPARILGIDCATGSIEPGKTADIIAVNDENEVVFTMVEGRIVYDRDNISNLNRR